MMKSGALISLLVCLPLVAQAELVQPEPQPLPRGAKNITPLGDVPEIMPKPDAVDAIKPVIDGKVRPQDMSAPAAVHAPTPIHTDEVHIQPLPQAAQTPPESISATPSIPTERVAAPRHRPPATIKRKNTIDPLHDALTQANAAFAGQRYAEALQQLAPFENAIFNRRDVDAARLQAWSAWHLQDFPLAKRWFVRAANWTNQADDMANVVRVELALQDYAAAMSMLARLPQSDAWRELRAQAHQAYALHAFKAGDYVLAVAQYTALQKLRPLDAAEWELLGWSHFKQAQYAAASSAFEQSLRAEPMREGAAQGLVFSLNQQNRLSEVFPLADALGMDTPLAQLAGDEEARRRLLSGRAQPRVTVDARAMILPAPFVSEAQPSHIRLGVFGKDNQTPFDEGNFRMHGAWLEGLASGERSRLWVTARAFNAKDEQQSVNGLRDLYLLGRHFTVDGTEISLGLGSTPQGGAISATWRGEIGLGWLDSEQGGRIRLARRPVEQSVLALTGAALPAQAEQPALRWGQVVREGLELEAYREFAAWKAEASLTAGRMVGEGVADNRMFEAYANLLHPMPSLLDGLSLGPVLYATGYEKNLSPFTPGNGGYYSPEYLLRLGALARYQLKPAAEKGLNLRMDLSLGWQGAREADAYANPLQPNPLLLRQAEQKNGMAATLDVDAIYRVDRHWHYGLRLSAQHSTDYAFFGGQIFAGYAW